MSAALPHLLATARSEPERIALVWNNQELTYPALLARIAAVRRRFERLGLEPGRIAAVLIEHLAQAWIAVLALQSLGLTTIALRSAEELESLDLPGLAYLVTRTGEGFPRLDASPASARLQRIVLGPIDPGELSLDLAGADLPAGGGHILSTSGTTGVYKRVLITAAQQPARVAAYVTVLGSTPRVTTYVGSLGLWTIAGYDGVIRAWFEGGTAVLDQRPQRYLPFTERRITWARLVPPELEAVLSAPETEDIYNPDLQLSVVGGALPWRLAEKAMARLTPQVFSILGSTEVGAVSITRVQEPGDVLNHAVNPSRHVEIADEAGQVLPPGAVGMLRIRLEAWDAREYLNDEAATRAHFVDGFFYPGDLGALGPDGRLSLHGRSNDVINFRGDKIATLPIEQAIQARLGARAVCLLSETGAGGEDRIYVVVERDRPVTEPERQSITGLIAGSDPVIHVLDALPRNDMGKVNRLALRRHLAGNQAAGG